MFTSLLQVVGITIRITIKIRITMIYFAPLRVLRAFLPLPIPNS